MTDVVTAKDAGGNVVSFAVITGTANALAPLGVMATAVEDGAITPISGSNPLSVTDAAAETSLATIATAQGAQGTGLNPPSGGAGLLGFLSGIYHTIASTLPISGTVAVSNFPTTQPISGTVTANAGTNLNTSALALETGGNLATTATGATASAAALGTTTDAAFGGSGASTVIAALKGLYALLSGTLKFGGGPTGTSLNNVPAATGPGTAINLGGAFNNISMQIVLGGSVPVTATLIDLQISLNGGTTYTTVATFDTSTGQASGQIVVSTDVPASFARANVVSFSGGTSPTIGAFINAA